MKKIFLFAFAIIPFLAISQDETNSKFPTPKSLMFEINAKPFAENQIISFEHFQTKYWLNEKIVLRLGIQLNNQKNEMAIEDWEEDANSTTPYIENSLLFGIKPGIEYRFHKSKFISPYIGLELFIKNKISSSKYTTWESYSYPYDQQEVITEVKNAWRSTSYYYGYEYDREKAYVSYGANILAGCDFYIVKNMYFGIEAGLGYEKIKYKKIKIIKSNNSTEQFLPSSKSIRLAFYYNSAIRFGFWF